MESNVLFKDTVSVSAWEFESTNGLCVFSDFFGKIGLIFLSTFITNYLQLLFHVVLIFIFVGERKRHNLTCGIC